MVGLFGSFFFAWGLLDGMSSVSPSFIHSVAGGRVDEPLCKGRG